MPSNHGLGKYVTHLRWNKSEMGKSVHCLWLSVIHSLHWPHGGRRCIEQHEKWVLKTQYQVISTCGSRTGADSVSSSISLEKPRDCWSNVCPFYILFFLPVAVVQRSPSSRSPRPGFTYFTPVPQPRLVFPLLRFDLCRLVLVCDLEL